MKQSINERLRLTTSRREYHIYRCVDQDPYPEMYGNYQYHKKGRRGWRKSKIIWPWEKRMYRTWKHNRKTKWTV